VNIGLFLSCGQEWVASVPRVVPHYLGLVHITPGSEDKDRRDGKGAPLSDF